jgi:hypothetical protein
MDECLVAGSPVGDFELLFYQEISLQDQECGDLILTMAKSSIYSTKPFSVHATTRSFQLSLNIMFPSTYFH